MKLPFMNDQCEQMLKICNEFVRLQVSYDEYLCMKVLLLLSTGNYGSESSSHGSERRNHGNRNYSGIQTSSKIAFPLSFWQWTSMYRIHL